MGLPTNQSLKIYEHLISESFISKVVLAIQSFKTAKSSQCQVTKSKKATESWTCAKQSAECRGESGPHQVLVVEGIQTSSGEGLDAGARSFAKSPAACSGRRVHVPPLRILSFHWLPPEISRRHWQGSCWCYGHQFLLLATLVIYSKPQISHAQHLMDICDIHIASW